MMRLRRIAFAMLSTLAPPLSAQTAAVAPDAPSLEAPASEPAESSVTEPLEAAPAVPAAAESADPGDIAEIIVTAQRREEKLQDVPLAVTAFSADQLEARGIGNIADLSALAPGLQISKTPSNSTISQISIRGVTQINPAIYWDPAVGIYVDGVYIGKAQGSIFDVVDLAAVEVLRGPQGTLYGRNTMAGAINLRTRAPSGELSGSASLDIGNYNSQVLKAAADLPKWGIVSLSVAARSERRDGWVKTTRTSPVNDLNDRHNDALRIAADFDFSADLKGEYRFDRSNIDQTPNWDQLYRADAATFQFLGFPDLPGYASRDRLKRADIDAPSYEEAKIAGHSFTLSWQLDDQNTFKSISGYRRLEWNDSLDIDGSPLPVAFTQRFTDYHQLSQDLQLLGSAGAFNYVGGVYYFGDKGNTNNPQSFFAGASTFDSRYTTESQAWAGYGQVDYKPVDPLTLSVGLRYTREKKELGRVFGCNQTAFGNPNCTPQGGADFVYLIPEGTKPGKTFSATTPMASASWRFDEQFNVYLRYAAGFKSGGFNGEYSNTTDTSFNIPETETPFKPEKQRSVEAGAKTTWLEGRALMNLAVFRNKLKDLQTSIFLGGQGSAAGSVIRNAGEATVNGAELELVLLPIKGTQLRASYAYLNADYDRFDDSGVNQADNRAFVHAPKNTFNLMVDSVLYRANWGLLRAVADYAYTDSFYTYAYQLDGSNPAAQNADDSKVDAYGMLNLRLVVADVPLSKTASGEFALWMRNVTDEDKANNFIDFGPGFGSLTVANFVEPRTFGVTAIVRW